MEEFRVSLAAARDIYGVLFHADSMEVDRAGTERLRERIRDRRRELAKQESADG